MEAIVLFARAKSYFAQAIALEVFMSVYIEPFSHHIRVFIELKLSTMCLAVPIMQGFLIGNWIFFFFLKMLAK